MQEERRPPEPSLGLGISGQQAYRESEASTLSHAFIDRGGPLWPWPNDLLHGPFGHLAEERIGLSSATRAIPREGGVGVRRARGLPKPHSQSGPPRFLHLVPRAATADQTLQRERLSQWSSAGGEPGGGPEGGPGEHAYFGGGVTHPGSHAGGEDPQPLGWEVVT